MALGPYAALATIAGRTAARRRVRKRGDSADWSAGGGLGAKGRPGRIWCTLVPGEPSDEMIAARLSTVHGVGTADASGHCSPGQ
jgi:hypothetical protein